jgi:hypothetical protein
MTTSNKTDEKQWQERKQSQKPHGKVKTFDQLADEAGKNDTKTK